MSRLCLMAPAAIPLAASAPAVIPAQAGIQRAYPKRMVGGRMDSRLRGNDENHRQTATREVAAW